MARMSTEAFQEVVLNNFHTASEQRKEDKKAIHTRIDRMEDKHTQTYISVFEKIEKNGKAIIANQTNILAIKEDVKDDVKKDIGKLEDGVKAVGKKAGTKSGAYSGIISSAVLKVIDKVFG